MKNPGNSDDTDVVFLRGNSVHDQGGTLPIAKKKYHSQPRAISYDFILVCLFFLCFRKVIRRKYTLRKKISLNRRQCHVISYSSQKPIRSRSLGFAHILIVTKPTSSSQPFL